MWLLIIIMFTRSGGIHTNVIEFKNNVTCEVAKAKIILRGNWSQAFCTKK